MEKSIFNAGPGYWQVYSKRSTSSGNTLNEQHDKTRDHDEVKPREKKPRVSIGMPVFNGEKMLEESLDSLLAQERGDFELIISDNGSTDNTEGICRTYVKRDPRIRYYRSSTNRGAAWNFNHVFECSRGEYFMWACHDDLWAPEFLGCAVAVLDQHPEVVLCYSATNLIDENGAILQEFLVNPGLASINAHQRFGAAWRYPPQIPVLGLMRSEMLKRTRLIGSYSSSDRTLVGELALLGPFFGIPEHLFSYRRHPQQSTGICYPNRRSRAEWYDPAKRGHISFPRWRLLREHIVSILRTPLTVSERFLCLASLARWMVRHRWELLANLVLHEWIKSQNGDMRTPENIRKQ